MEPTMKEARLSDTTRTRRCQEPWDAMPHQTSDDTATATHVVVSDHASFFFESGIQRLFMVFSVITRLHSNPNCKTNNGCTGRLTRVPECRRFALPRKAQLIRLRRLREPPTKTTALIAVSLPIDA